MRGVSQDVEDALLELASAVERRAEALRTVAPLRVKILRIGYLRRQLLKLVNWVRNRRGGVSQRG
jgi:hypothetical protein